MLCERAVERVSVGSGDPREEARTDRPNKREDILVKVDVVLSSEDSERKANQQSVPRKGTQERVEPTRLGTLIGTGMSSVVLPTIKTRLISADMTSRTEGGARAMAEKAVGRETAVPGVTLPASETSKERRVLSPFPAR